MSFRRPNFGSRSASVGRQQVRSLQLDANNNSASKNDVLPDILPEVQLLTAKYSRIIDYFSYFS